MTESTTRETWAHATTPVQVQLSGQIPADVGPYAERRLREAFAETHFPVLHARVRLTHYADPALERPVVGQANLDVNGRSVRVQLRAPTAREAVDLLHDRLAHRLRNVVQRAEGSWEDRRARFDVSERQLAGEHYDLGDDHEWRHGDEPTHRPPYFPRPPEEREVVRHKSVTPARCGIDEAAADMEDMGFDFHLFTEAGTHEDAVLYRSGPTGYRLAEVTPRPDAELAPHSLLVTVSDQPAPHLSIEEATARMAVWDRPFLFFRDAATHRGAVLYHRYDGHYGLISPAGPAAHRTTHPGTAGTTTPDTRTGGAT